ncbi:MAG: ATP-binding cassette domain-containing protein [Candidatus Marinimicrobia bacterium]|nr:ATP-binding cassette domain-containing protein [Candidatus Neomarinimicrobiota bacterium]MBP9005908.1 ATP-binding cassette domain-containing protein [Candidatus Neomarinimicrobiota bacterium]NLA21602.1 ATP-binding cassette domain-containing protein [Candidatus Neomarinimicrobiota bacterium]HOU17014.1 ATP-binding cassette domain-containing protein [Candidatus Neomarinimicrobiota bacterium]HQE95400.1 ATP-binding cassette domain-containing protein [Candidatus Neomarinimicrobiota bacterium]
MIEVQNLVKHYGSVKAVDNISFTVEKGEILGFLGPNAAGKTTTMRIITGYMPASAGTVKVAGYDVFEQGLEVKKRIGYLPENPPLYSDMRVREYLTFVARIKGVNPKTINAEVDRVAERLSVLEVMDNLISNLSKGYKQRVGLAQALLNNPPVLIFDEPTNGLDPRQIIEVREIIKSLGSDHTVILSTHILPEVSMTCNRVAIINEGKLVKIDTPENLTKQLRGSESIILQVEGPMNEVELALSQHQSVTAVAVQPTGKENIATYRVETSIGSDIRKELASLVVNRGWGLLELKAESLSLEDIFLKLTTKEEEVN